MAYNQVVLDLDISGKNIDNKIVNEPHTLSNRPVRAIAVNYGPFFAEGLEIMDGARVLDRGVDFQLVELHQEATLKYGKEIVSVILIINKSVPSDITVTYQALGGHYMYSDTAVSNMYSSLINDNRPVDWANIFDKPTEFNPAIHRHLLDDIYGFEPVVDYLERIKRAITLGQTTVVMELINQLISNFRHTELRKNKPTKKLIQHDALLYFLSRRKILNPIWVDRKDAMWYKGDSAVLHADTSHYPAGRKLYWEFYKPNDTIGLFSCKSGSIIGNGGIVEFQVYVPAQPDIIEYPLYVGVKENETDDDFVAVTYVVEIQEHTETDCVLPYMVSRPQDFRFSTPIIADFADDEDKALYFMLTSY